MPLLTLDPSQVESLDTAVQQQDLNPPASPTPPLQTPNPDPATPPGPARSLGETQIFTPFVAHDQNDKSSVELLDNVNNYLKQGGKLSSLDTDMLRGIDMATSGGDGKLVDRDVLDDPEKFYQLKFKTGKYDKPPLDALGNPYQWPQMAVDFVANGLGAIENAVVGAYQTITHPQTAIAATAEGLEATKQFYKSLNPLMEVPGMGVLGVAAAPGFQAIARDMADRTLKMFSKDPHMLEQIDRDQSEIARGNMLRAQSADDAVEASKYKAADSLASIGLNQMADMVQKAQVTPQQQGLFQMLTDPMTYLEFGIGKAGEMASNAGVRFSRLDAATTALKTAADSVDNLSIQKRGFQGIIDSARQGAGATAEEGTAAQRALAAQAPIERDAIAAHQAAVQEHQAATLATTQELNDAAQPGIGRQWVGQAIQGGGKLAELAGNVSDWVTSIPDKIVETVMPGADPVAKGILASTIRHTIGSVIGGGPLSGGALTGLLSKTGSEALQKYGRDIAMVGEQFALGQQTLPFWKSIKENSTGMTRIAASVLDNQLVYSIPDTARAAMTASAIGGTIGYLSSGGTTQGLLGGAGPGFVLGAAGAGLGQIRKFNSPAELHAASIGDRARFIRTLNPANTDMFSKLDPHQQLGISVFARAHPDLNISFFSDPAKTQVNGYHQVVDGKGLVSINVNGDNPFQAVLAHEVGHHIAAHGLGDDVNSYILGDVATGRPGAFTKYGDDSKPLIETDANGIQRYVPNDEFEAYKANYNARLPKASAAAATATSPTGIDPTVIKGLMKRGFSKEQAEAFAAKATVSRRGPGGTAPPPLPEQAQPAYIPKAGNYDVAQELFADLHATRFTDPAEVQRMVRGYVPSAIAGDNVLSNWLTRVGVGADPVTGRSVITDAVAKTRGLNDIITNFYRQRSYKANPVSDDTGHVKVPIQGVRKGTDEFGRLAQTFDSTTEIRRNPDGTIWTDSAGRPQLVSLKEMDAQHGRMTDDVISAIKANPQYETAPGDYLKLVTDRRNRTYYRGQIVPPEVFDALAASNQHNASQILNWRKLNGIMTRNDGTMVTQVYNTAGRRGKYATLPAQERAVVPLYNEISPTNKEITIFAYDPEQMTQNITKVLRRGAAQKLWDGKIETATADVRTYLENLVNNRPGETGIGLEKKGVINNLFGLAADANPLVDDVTRKSPSVFKSFRLDRMNRVNELGITAPFGRQTYEQVRGYAQPRVGFEGVPMKTRPPQL